MARSLDQVDVACAALEITVPANYQGIRTMVSQNNLAIESQLQGLLTKVGSPVDATGAPNPSGLFATLGSVQTLTANLQAQIAALQAQLGTLQTSISTIAIAEGVDATNITGVNASLTILSVALTALTARVHTLDNL
jgi:hypothetical protein